MLRFTRAAVCVVLTLFATAASAQTYPSGPVKLIVPIPAGGVTDVMARVIGQRLQEIWGQTVVVENRPGGNSGVGAQGGRGGPSRWTDSSCCAGCDLHRKPAAVLETDL